MGDGSQDHEGGTRGADAPVARFLGANALAAEMNDWRDLAANAAEANAFYAPALLVPALEAFTADAAEVAVIRDRSGVLIGLAPVALLKGYSRLPVPYLATWMHPHCFFAAPLVRKGRERGFFRALFDLVERRSVFFRLRHLDANGPLFAAAAAVAAETGRLAAPSSQYQRATLVAPWSTDEYLKVSLNGKRRKNLRRRRTRLEEEGAVAFEMLAPGGDADAWADAFLAVEASGWKGEAGTALRQDPASAKFFREAVRRAQAAGELQFFRFLLGDHPLAYAVNFQCGDVSYAFKIAYDEAFARYSPGVMIEIEIMQALEGLKGLSRIDSCAKAEHPMIERLWRGRRTISALNISRRDAPSKGLFRLLTILERASERARAKRRQPAAGETDGDL